MTSDLNWDINANPKPLFPSPLFLPHFPSPFFSPLSFYIVYAVGIDMTARNAQNVAKRHGLPWTAAKGFDTFLPLSERIRKSSLPPDPHSSDVELFLSVNGEVRQTDSTSLMLFRIPTILSHVSRIMTLQPGDVVLTGTPKGVGSVQVGDVMRAGIRVGGKEVEEGSIEVGVEEKGGIFRFDEDMKD